MLNNIQYDPNPLKDISPEQAIYLSNSSDPDVKRNAQYVLCNFQRHFQEKQTKDNKSFFEKQLDIINQSPSK